VTNSAENYVYYVELIDDYKYVNKKSVIDSYYLEIKLKNQNEYLFFVFLLMGLKISNCLVAMQKFWCFSYLFNQEILNFSEFVLHRFQSKFKLRSAIDFKAY